jgi:hypothetical protein
LEVTEDVDLRSQENISLANSLKYSHQFQSSTKDEQIFQSHYLIGDNESMLKVCLSFSQLFMWSIKLKKETD